MRCIRTALASGPAGHRKGHKQHMERLRSSFERRWITFGGGTPVLEAWQPAGPSASLQPQCLQIMAKRNRCDGTVEDAIFLGDPLAGVENDWQRILSVVSWCVIYGYYK
ncbi:unnamed protein product [Soboliphyme baturini]|uniref:Uncharacterized protein n=1 Tax=Soboliphyme baturini TaxID=241478 RepID=A0A183IBF8_9BILA|nr:unnamed protein product [Soboliphyme baturini]